MSDWVLKVDQIAKEYRLGKGMLKNLTAREFIVDQLQQFNPFHKYQPKLQEATTFWALEDISFSVDRGQTVGIIGRNGAGKSTLLKILSKITPPTKGHIQSKGRVTSLLEVGTGFHPELSGKENIFLNGAILGLTRREIKGRFDAIVDFSGVEKFLETPLKRYSSGMLVRLAFSVAAHLNPDVLIIDEVLAVGDLDFQKKCLQKMEDVSKSGKTILFVSHNNEHILRICKQGILLEHGRLIHSGPIEGVIQTYLNHSRQLTTQSLEERQDRKGSGQFRVQHIELLSPQGENVELLSPSKPYQVIFHYQLAPDFQTTDFLIRVSLFNNMGIKVCEHSNQLTGYHLSENELKQARQIVLTVQHFPFPQGDYYLSYEVWSQGYCLDALQDAKVIGIDNSPYGVNLRNPPLSGGTTLIQGSWSCGGA